SCDAALRTRPCWSWLSESALASSLPSISARSEPWCPCKEAASSCSPPTAGSGARVARGEWHTVPRSGGWTGAWGERHHVDGAVAAHASQGPRDHELGRLVGGRDLDEGRRRQAVGRLLVGKARHRGPVQLRERD